MRMNNEERKKVLLAIFTDKTLWGIVTGLRGPDETVGRGKLKTETTARLRGKIVNELGLRDKVQMDFLTTVGCEVSFDKLSDQLPPYSPNNNHFIQHHIVAMYETKLVFSSPSPSASPAPAHPAKGGQ